MMVVVDQLAFYFIIMYACDNSKNVDTEGAEGAEAPHPPPLPPPQVLSPHSLRTFTQVSIYGSDAVYDLIKAAEAPPPHLDLCLRQWRRKLLNFGGALSESSVWL